MERLSGGNKISSDFFFTAVEGKTTKEGFMTTWRRIIPLIIAGLGIGLMIIGLWVNHSKLSQNRSGEQLSRETSLVSDQAFSRRLILVDIGGAVERPGVIETYNDSRIKDVLISAGGLSAKADRTYISKNINLAQRAFDGMKLYFPSEGEVLHADVDVAKSYAGKDTDKQSLQPSVPKTPININVASQSELESLPGVGPVTASKIINGRSYQNTSELINRKIIGKSVFEKIKNMVTVR